MTEHSLTDLKRPIDCLGWCVKSMLTEESEEPFGPPTAMYCTGVVLWWLDLEQNQHFVRADPGVQLPIELLKIKSLPGIAVEIHGLGEFTVTCEQWNPRPRMAREASK